jgi:hypothetical protein
MAAQIKRIVVAGGLKAETSGPQVIESPASLRISFHCRSHPLILAHG